jgi:hypothetical protein
VLLLLLLVLTLGGMMRSLAFLVMLRMGMVAKRALLGLLSMKLTVLRVLRMLGVLTMVTVLLLLHMALLQVLRAQKSLGRVHGSAVIKTVHCLVGDGWHLKRGRVRVSTVFALKVHILARVLKRGCLGMAHLIRVIPRALITTTIIHRARVRVARLSCPIQVLNVHP